MRLLICGGLLLIGILNCPGAEQFRAARSVHLSYPAPDGICFYNEMIVDSSVNGSYFMSCGWNTGYFGLQQLQGETNKVVIFSVWDPTRGDDPKAVKQEDRVEVLYTGVGVKIKRFGGEGTGAQCMAPFSWQLGETNRFGIVARVEGEKTSYTAWIMSPDTQRWRKLATFRTLTGGKVLKGLYSFIEDFRRDGKSVKELRRARFGPPWVKAKSGDWQRINVARFTASNAEWESKDNIDAGFASDRFYLATGGEIQNSRELRSEIRLSPDKAGAEAAAFLRSFDEMQSP